MGPAAEPLIALLEALIGAPVAATTGPDVAAFWRGHLGRTADVSFAFDRAVLGGLHADRLGHAFAAGYECALQALVPSLSRARLASLCATEVGGVQPRAIASTLRSEGAGWRLSGRKVWVTLGLDAEVLFVVASAGTDDAGRNRLRLVAVDATRAGVVRSPLEPAPFVPEIGHAGVAFENVAVREDEVLPGDGYDRYLKPFRTIEDLHVQGAVLGHLVRMARDAAARADALEVPGAAGGDAPRAEPGVSPQALIEELLALVAQLRALAAEPSAAPAVHVALAGALRAFGRFLEGVGPLFARADPETRERWNRDAPLLKVADRARAARRASAWRAVAQRRDPGKGEGDEP